MITPAHKAAGAALTAAVALSNTILSAATEDCSLAGVWKGPGIGCDCDPGWVGSDCGSLDVKNDGVMTTVFTTGPRGYPGTPVGEKNDTIGTVWGGHAAQDRNRINAAASNSTWHWYGSAILNNHSMGSWTSCSSAGHAVGSSPTGPFKLVDIAVRPGGNDDGGGNTGWYNGSVHDVYLTQNPRPWSNKTDMWLLFFTAMPKKNPLGNRQIGVAYAAHLEGPWIVWPRAVLGPNKNSTAVDTSSVSNAAPAFTNDGSGRLLLAYKGLGKAAPGKPVCTDGSGRGCISVAVAPHWTGPYDPVTANAGIKIEGEDPTLFQDRRGNWHMLYELYNRPHKTFSGRHAYSATGLSDWQLVPPTEPYWGGLNITLDGKPKVKLTNRERYQIVLDENGNPAWLYNGAHTYERPVPFNIVASIGGRK